MNSPPRQLSIAFVTSLPRWGGGEKWFLEAATAMAGRGHRVLVVGQPGGEILRRARGRGLRVHGMPMHGIFDPRTLFGMAALLRRERMQVAVVNQAREIRLVGLSQLGRRGFRLIARRGSPDPIKDVWHFRLVYRHLVDRLIVNASALIEPVCGGAPWFDRSKLAVLHNGIDVDGFRSAASGLRGRASLELSESQRLVVMVGELGARKDQRSFVRAIAELGDAHPEVVFAIAGEGPERGALEAESRALGLDAPRLRWLGFRDDAADLLAASELVVLPSRQEGFPNTLLEAMALGRTVVATPVDGIPELVVDGETGLLVPAGDPSALSVAMDRVLGDEALRARMGSAAELRVRREFDQERKMQELESLIR